MAMVYYSCGYIYIISVSCTLVICGLVSGVWVPVVLLKEATIGRCKATCSLDDLLSDMASDSEIHSSFLTATPIL